MVVDKFSALFLAYRKIEKEGVMKRLKLIFVATLLMAVPIQFAEARERYVVQPGDTISRIAVEEFGLSWSEVSSSAKRRHRIHPGEVVYRSDLVSCCREERRYKSYGKSRKSYRSESDEYYSYSEENYRRAPQLPPEAYVDYPQPQYPAPEPYYAAPYPSAGYSNGSDVAAEILGNAVAGFASGAGAALVASAFASDYPDYDDFYGYPPVAYAAEYGYGYYGNNCGYGNCGGHPGYKHGYHGKHGRHGGYYGKGYAYGHRYGHGEHQGKGYAYGHGNYYGRNHSGGYKGHGNAGYHSTGYAGGKYHAASHSGGTGYRAGYARNYGYGRNTSHISGNYRGGSGYKISGVRGGFAGVSASVQRGHSSGRVFGASISKSRGSGAAFARGGVRGGGRARGGFRGLD